MGEVGLSSAAGAKVPSKSFEYIVENRSFARELGRGNTLPEALCLSLMALADAWASLAGLEGASDFVGVSRAFADFTLRGLADIAVFLFSLCLSGLGACFYGLEASLLNLRTPMLLCTQLTVCRRLFMVLAGGITSRAASTTGPSFPREACND